MSGQLHAPAALSLTERHIANSAPLSYEQAQFVATLTYLQFCKYNRSMQLALIEASKFGDVVLYPLRTR